MLLHAPVEGINRIFGKYDSIDRVVILAYFWPDYNCLFYEIAIQTLLTSVVGVARRFGVPRAFAVLSMSVGYDTRSMLREKPLLR